MSTLKKLTAVMVSALVFVLAGCDSGQKVNTLTMDQAKRLADGAADKARAEEAAKADGKLGNAKVEAGKLGTNAARQGGFSAEANCNVIPAEVGQTQAAKDFPKHVISFYKEACVKEVAKMNAERSANRNRAVAMAKERERKAAAEKARQQQLASARPVKQAVARSGERRN